MRPARLAALFGPALALAVGAVAARTLLPEVRARFPVDVAQPLLVANGWGGLGERLVAILAMSVVAGAVALVLALRGLARAPERGDLAALLAAAAAGLAAALAWPLIFSSDVYAYAAYGAAALAGLDPYRVLPPGTYGAFYAAARWQWTGTAYPVCVYGPAFVAIARAAVAFGGSVAATLLGLRLLACAAFLASVALLWHAVDPARAGRRLVLAAAYALNPVCLWSAAEGHNDTLMMAAVFAGAVLWRRGFALSGPAVAALAATLKAPALAAAAALAVRELLSPRSSRRGVAGAILGAAAAAAIAVPAQLPALRAVRHAGHYAPAASPQALVGPGGAALLAAAALAAGTVMLLRRRPHGYAWLGIATIAALPNGYPWYALWLVPAALAAGGGIAATALWAATILGVVRYLPDAYGTVGADGSRIVAAISALPLIVAAALSLTARRKKAQAPS